MPSRHRLDIKGPGLFFVTTTVKKHIRLFENRKLAFEVIVQFAETSAFMKVSIVAYVLMPSHLHALVGLEDSSILSKYIQSFKSLSSRRVKNLGSDDFKDQFYAGGKFILWQPRFDDVLVCTEKQFEIKLDYIHNNPVKAGLVSRAEDFLFSSARDWLGDGKGLIEIDRGFGWLSGI